MVSYLESFLFLLVITSLEATEKSASLGFTVSPSVKKTTEVKATFTTGAKNNYLIISTLKSTNMEPRFIIRTEPTTTETTSCTTETTTEITTIETSTDETFPSTLEDTTLETMEEITLSSRAATSDSNKVTPESLDDKLFVSIDSNNQMKPASSRENEITRTNLNSDISMTTSEVTKPNNFDNVESSKINSYDSPAFETHKVPSHNSYSNSKSNTEYSPGSNSITQVPSNSSYANHEVYDSNKQEKAVSQNFATEIAISDISSKNSSASMNISIDIDISIGFSSDNSTVKPDFPRKRVTSRQFVAGIVLIILISVSAVSAVIFAMMPNRRRIQRGYRNLDRVELISGREKYRPEYKYYDTTLYMRR